MIKNGGRVMKNVTGYDLVKLMAGSYGTLGVLTEVSFKVLPQPEAVAVLHITGLDDRAAVQAMAQALTSPFEVSGAAHLPAGADGAGETLIRLEGFTQSVNYRAEQLATLLGPAGAVRIETDAARAAATWRQIRDVTLFAGRPGDVWRISVKPSDGPDIVAAITERQPEAEVLYDWGGGLLWVLTAEGDDLRRHDFQGHATLLRASDATHARLGTFHPEPAPLAAIAAGLRAKFDPRGILNPGLMG